MAPKTSEARSDDLLVPFLDARSETASDELLRVIIAEHAEPIITRIVRRKLRVSLSEHGTQQNQDALEIAGDLPARIISSLRALRQHPATRPIVGFPDFVAIKTYSACADYFREKHPQRWKLKDLLRRHLKQNPRFALWQIARPGQWRPDDGALLINRGSVFNPGGTRCLWHDRHARMPALQSVKQHLLTTRQHRL